MAGSASRTVLPILPLARDNVLLPGTTLRIPTAKRADARALLNAIYLKSSEVGCLPLCSPLLGPDGQALLGPDGQALLEDGDKARGRAPERGPNPDAVSERDLFAYGVVARVTGLQGRRLNDLSLVVEGVRRFRVDRVAQLKPYVECEVTPLGEELIDSSDTGAKALFGQLKQASRELLAVVRLSAMFPGATNNMSAMTARRLEIHVARKELAEAGHLCDLMASMIDTSFEEKLQVLASLDVRRRMEIVLEVLKRQLGGLQGANGVKITTISTSLPGSGADNNNNSLVRQAFGGIKGIAPPGLGGMPGGGGDGDAEVNELDELKTKLDEAGMPPEAQKAADKELKRLRKMNPAGAEYGVCRTYLETLAEIPWSASTEDKLGADTLRRARKQLDDDHYGLDKIKKRLLEYLAVLKLKQALNADIDSRVKRVEEEAASKPPTGTEQRDESQEMQIALLKRKQVDKSPIMLLVGPPGTGKTSLAKSVATALGRKFHRISLGGVRDEAEIRGHRRTYVAAMPGLIVNGLKKVAVNNPVFLLDEIDKVGGANFHGDPSAAMLEVLDPEQNHTFVDHYVNVPLDLSKVLFIATANSLDTIPAPLLDRMETISLSGYTTLEKRHIATRHLVPKQVSANGLTPADLDLASAAIDGIIASYTREAGVRSLEREIGAVCRYKAVQYADARDSEATSYSPHVAEADLETILGQPHFDDELVAAGDAAMPGVVTGLVAYAGGGYGSILFIEVADMPGGAGRVQLTGKLGDVLKESVEVALSWVKAHAFDLGLAPTPDADLMARRSIHVHCPSGAIPKDGPSAGVAHVVALVSLFSGRPVRPDLAMTGEVSLRGRVMPVGGIKEKLLGAMRAGVTEVLLPVGNKRDINELPDEVKQGLVIRTVDSVWEALRYVWPGTRFEGLALGESRL